MNNAMQIKSKLVQIISALIMLGALFTPLTASADEFTLSNPQWPVLKVVSSGYQYTNSSTIAYGWQADIEIDPPHLSRVKQWEVHPQVETAVDLAKSGKSAGPDLSNWKVSKKYPVGSRPLKVNTTVSSQIPGVLGDWAAQQCKALQANLQTQGMSKEEIFSIDRHIAVNWRLKYKYSYIRDGASSFGQAGPYTEKTQSVIICQRWQSPAAAGVANVKPNPQKLKLTGTDFSLFYTAATQCPKSVLLSSKVYSNTAGQIELWYEIQDAQAGSKKSITYTLNTGTIGAGGNVETTHSDSVSIPLPGWTPSNPSTTTSGYGSGTDDFKPGGSGGNGGPSIVGGSAEFGNEVGGASNQHVGKMRVVARVANLPKLGKNKPGMKVVSAWKDYNITCDPQTTGIVTNQTMAIEKTPLVAPKSTMKAESGSQVAVANSQKNVDKKIAMGNVPATTGNNQTTGVYMAPQAKPDLMATPMGMVLAGAPRTWGTTVMLNSPSSAAQKGLGIKKDLCKFHQAAYRPFNKGSVDSGLFNAKVLRSNQVVNSVNLNLAAQSGLPGDGWHKFDLLLAEGMNVIKVKLDTGKKVAESDESNNNYTLKVKVNFPCTVKQPTVGGNGKINSMKIERKLTPPGRNTN